MLEDISRIANLFAMDGIYQYHEENTIGNINKTYIIHTTTGKRYVLQRINKVVFNEPHILMYNIEGITEHIKAKCAGNSNAKCLELIYTKERRTNGRRISLYKDENENYWRMYNYIEGCKTYDKNIKCKDFYEVGRGFGTFQKLLQYYPMDKLSVVIKDFHNTVKRYNNFIEDIQKNPCYRAQSASSEIVEIMGNAIRFYPINTMIARGYIPTRVTHNDTKINNVMVNAKTGKAECVIDLDTVMPGSILFDFGDAIRSGANLAGEEEEDISKVKLDLELFKAFTTGYLFETKDMLLPSEIAFLVDSCYVITLELAMRFLNDYINGDTYFKCEKENHNLYRARNQLALARDIKEKMPEMRKIVKEICISFGIK